MPLPKNTPSKGGENRSSGWHPNFRDFTQLPDTKVVRTSFFVNGVTALITFGLAVLFVYQEYKLADLNKQIVQWTAKIEEQQKPSDQGIALYKQFQEEQRKLNEVDEFLSAEKLSFTEFVLRLGDMLPKNIALTYIDYNTTTVTLRGLVKGEPDLASGIASAFEKQLRDDADLSKKFGSIGITNLTRDAQSGRLNFEIAMRFDVGGKKK